MKEIYKQIPEFPDHYQVSNLGNVRRGNKHLHKINPLKPKKSGRDRMYQSVALSVEGTIYYRYIHRLVMETFVGPCPDGHQVNHKDGDKTNNHLDNLEYVTPSENQKHAHENGLLPKPPTHRGEMAPKAKLTADQVREIRRLYIPYKFGAQRLAKMFGVSKHSVQMIVNRKSWTHI